MVDRLRKEDWEVHGVATSVARLMISKYHYAGGAGIRPCYVHGLFPRGAFWDIDCMGVAWWQPPIKAAAVATFPERWQGVLALSRLVIHPDVPANACSFLLSRSAKLIPADVWPCLVTYADEGQGHTGAIYRACNWEYCGVREATETYVRGGRMVSRKQGKDNYSHEQMLAMGCETRGASLKHKFRLVRR